MSLQWETINYNDGSGSWLEAAMPLGLYYAAAKHKSRWLAELGDAGGNPLWTSYHRTKGAAIAACEEHAEAFAKDWIQRVGEPKGKAGV